MPKIVAVAVHLVIEMVGHLAGDGVHIVVIVAVLGGVRGQPAQRLVPLPVGAQGGQPAWPCCRARSSNTSFLTAASEFAATASPMPVMTGPTLYLAPPRLRSLPTSRQCSLQAERKGRGTISRWTRWAVTSEMTVWRQRLSNWRKKAASTWS